MSAPFSGKYEVLDQLAEEFAERFRRGERPALKEYLDRYPELAAEIRELFPAMVHVVGVILVFLQARSKTRIAATPAVRRLGREHAHFAAAFRSFPAW
jgi:hypothetical protein